MKIKQRITKAIPFMKPAQIKQVEALLKLQSKLLDLRDEIKTTVGRGDLKTEYDNYTNFWLTAFATDVAQLGSLASLIDGIIGEYVDDEGELCSTDAD